MTAERLACLTNLVEEASRDHQPMLVAPETWADIVRELLEEIQEEPP